MQRFLVLAITLGLAGACHKSAPATTATAKADPHANMPAEVVKFHDVLAPKWHADKGAQRTKDTCGAVGEFTADADALAKLAPPAGADAAKWAASTKELVEAVAALKATCEPLDDAKFETAFAHMHESFHHVGEATGAMHEEHEGMDHHEGMEHHEGMDHHEGHEGSAYPEHKM